jgi:hypothetical protein
MERSGDSKLWRGGYHIRRRWSSTGDDRPHNRRGAMAGLAIAVVLLVIGLWLAHALTASSKMQDCLMSGRTNCNVIEPAR